MDKIECVQVYICTYNEKENITECIKSVVSAGCGKITIVDSSSDELTEDRGRAAGAEVIKSKKGLASQRQVAISNCREKYLMFVDADDRLDTACISTLLGDMSSHGYDAAQSSLRVYQPKSYWQKAMDANLEMCINKIGPTKMVGRPALYKTVLLKEVGMDTTFDGVGNEDAALSIRMEKAGASQGISRAICYRFHPVTFRENFQAWRKYGKGDANILQQYPSKLYSVLKHLLFVYPVKRSSILIKNGSGRYAGYTVLIGLVRFYYMFIVMMKNKMKEFKC